MQAVLTNREGDAGQRVGRADPAQVLPAMSTSSRRIQQQLHQVRPGPRPGRPEALFDKQGYPGRPAAGHGDRAGIDADITR